ncbi:hypothetical protein EDD16DRAFT_221889 [Pisolithus croceorrhizus]|nr:hypothetical protein EDD16DRAFT_221889 [Pisolithus croceorrhizus]KAI6158577.1 hypothetical protein EDD17DRAFT_1003989 [Pisolithus thermaeus]
MAGRRWELLLLLSYTHSLYNQAHRGWGKWRVTELLNMTNFFREARALGSSQALPCAQPTICQSCSHRPVHSLASSIRFDGRVLL